MAPQTTTAATMQLASALRSLPRVAIQRCNVPNVRRIYTAPVVCRQARHRGGEGDEKQLAPRGSSGGYMVPRLGGFGVPAFGDLEKEMDSLLRSFGVPTPSSLLTRGAGMPGMMSLAVDVKDEGTNYKIQADLPGMKKEDVKIELSPDHQVMTISGERKHEERTEEGEGNIVRLERSYGSFVRSFRLPEHVDPTNIKAHMKNGVLELTLPKTEKTEEEAKTIKIEVDEE